MSPAIGGMVMERGEESPEEPLRQFREAAQKLDGTGVDLVITCETMMMNQPVGSGENPENPGPILTEYMEFARRNRCTVAGAAHSRRRKKQAVHSVLRTGRFSARNVS
ncbi:MAG: hypothetical protein V8T87_13180 [Victivallales bacterium]